MAMKFIPYDHNTYLVRSRTRRGHHILDVEEVTCSCEGFNYYTHCEHLRQLLRQLGRTDVVNTTVTVDLSQFI